MNAFIDKGLILGASSGIGKVLAAEIKLDPRYSEIDWMTPGIEDCDVSEADSIKRWISANGPFRYMVYCPGYNDLMWISKMDPSSLKYTYDVNVGGFILMLAAHEERFPGYEGSVVAISSDASRIPMRTSIAYCSSKAALNMAVKCAARELSPRWQVNAVAPGIIEGTEMTKYIDEEVPKIRGWDADAARAYEQSMIPMGRRGWRGEVAKVIRDLLVSPKYLTGSIIEISGGK